MVFHLRYVILYVCFSYLVPGKLIQNPKCKGLKDIKCYIKSRYIIDLDYNASCLENMKRKTITLYEWNDILMQS